ncbi:MAG TPA: M1 family aminopeptidase [Desulfobacteria bacterium]|nr:M1 family aminopeptidase [Desulfobacteria bacterium]
MTNEDTWSKRINILNLNRLEEQVASFIRQKRYLEALSAAERLLETAKSAYGPQYSGLAVYHRNISDIKKLIASVDKGAPIAAGQNLEKPMSKFALRAALVLITVFIVSALFVYNQLSTYRSGDTNSAYASASSAVSDVPVYRVKAAFDPVKKVLEGEEEVVFHHAIERNELVFNLYFNRYNNEGLKSSEMRKFALKKGFDRGYIDVLAVEVKGKEITFEQKGEILRIRAKEGIFPQGETNVKILFRLKIPYILDRSGGNSNGVWLGNWLPTLKVGSTWQRPTEIGDPFVNYSSTYQTEFTLPKEYSLVLSNTYSIEDRGDVKVYRSSLEKVRDLPVFFNRSYVKAWVHEGQTEINYYFRPGGSRRPGDVLDIARRSLAFYEDYVGDYPWKQLNIVETEMYLNGMEYSTMVLVSPKAAEKSMEQTLFHEVGHQWFYNIIGSDQYEAAFIDEGLVEFLTCFILERKPPRSYDQVTGLDKSLDDFGSWQKYRETHYYKGRKLFESIYISLGKTEFEKFIKEYYDKYEFSLVSSQEFRKFLEEKMGKESAKALLQ